MDDWEAQQVYALLEQNQIARAISLNFEVFCEAAKYVVEYYSACSGLLVLGPCKDAWAVNLYRYHEYLTNKYETIDYKGHPIPLDDYQIFKDQFDKLLILKNGSNIYKAPQLWDEQGGQIHYILQAYYLNNELRKKSYDCEGVEMLREFYKIGYKTPLHTAGDYALQFLDLLVDIHKEYLFAKTLKQKAEEYSILLPELPGEVPPLLEMYHANLLLPTPVTPIVWLQCHIAAIDIIDRRIEWLNTIQNREADTLAQYGVSDEQIAQIKYDCFLLRKMYRRLKELQLHNGDISDFLQSFPEEDRQQAEYKVLLENISTSEFVALSQAIIDTVYSKMVKSPMEIIARIPDYLGKIVATNIIDFVKSLHIAESTRQLYLRCDPNDRTLLSNHTLPIAAPTIELRNQCFDHYIDTETENIKKEFAYDQSRVNPISTDECYQMLLNRTKAYLQDCKNRYEPNKKVAETCSWQMVYKDIYLMADAFLNYLDKKITPQQHTIDSSRLPREKKYQEVARWLETEKKEGRDHLAMAEYNRAQMCRNISKIVGWEVDSNSLGKYLNRNQTSKKDK